MQLFKQETYICRKEHSLQGLKQARVTDEPLALLISLTAIVEKTVCMESREKCIAYTKRGTRICRGVLLQAVDTLAGGIEVGSEHVVSPPRRITDGMGKTA